MITYVRTQAENPDFINLVSKLDAYLAETDGDEHEFYHQFNGLSDIKYAIVGYQDDTPIACGAIKALDNQAMEVKRMYTKPSFRGLGIASQLLEQLEVWAKELGYKACRLETGNRQLEAVQLYKKNNYMIIPNYGHYKGVENSICFEKTL